MEIVGAGLQAFIEQHGDMLTPFRQRFPWLGPDLQTVRNSFMKRPVIQVHKRLLAKIDLQGQHLSLSATYPATTADCGRAVLLVHGLGGHEDSHYMAVTAARFLQEGWSVYRMNFRGAGRSKGTSSPPYSGGLTEDLRSALAVVAADADGRKLFALGFSLGGQLLLRTLGEGGVQPKLCAAATVSAPLNLSTTVKKLHRPRNSAYVRYLVQNMMRDMGRLGQEQFGVEPEKLTSVWAFDEYIIAPAFGYKGAEDYYLSVSCFPVLQDISTPLLAIHSKDDPWIPWEDYRMAKWSDNKIVGAILLERGGHVGFHCGVEKGVWFEANILNFFNKF